MTVSKLAQKFSLIPSLLILIAGFSWPFTGAQGQNFEYGSDLNVSQHTIRSSIRDVSGLKSIDKLAIVVGVDKYFTNPLDNAVDDADSVSKSLRAIGYLVKTLRDPSAAEIVAFLQKEEDTLAKAKEVLFFFSGHGFNLNSENYLLPSTTKEIDYYDQVKVQDLSIPINSIINRFNSAKIPIQILIFDVCRNNPILRKLPNNGAMNISIPAANGYGIGIIFATANGDKSWDGNPNSQSLNIANSVFTSSLVKVIEIPRLSFTDIATNVKTSVLNQTKGQQVPRELQSGLLNSYFINNKLQKEEASFQQRPISVNLPYVFDSTQISEVYTHYWSNKDYLLNRADYLHSAGFTSPSIKLYKRAAALESAEACYRLGCIYQYGNEVRKNLDSAFYYFSLGMELGHTDCIYKYGVFHDQEVTGELTIPYKSDRFENILQQDYETAILCYKIAAGQGHALAQNVLGVHYQYGIGVLTNYRMARKLYEKAAEQGHRSAINHLGEMYFNGNLGPPDYARAFSYFIDAANRGNPESYYSLGYYYATQDKTIANTENARLWLTRSAGSGNMDAIGALKTLYEDNRISSENYVEGFNAFVKFVETSKEPAGYYSLAMLFAEGDYIAQDSLSAIRFFKKAADEGYEEALLTMGDIYLHSKLVKPDPARAINYFQSAAELENLQALKFLARAYYNGQYVVQDQQKGIYFFERVADITENYPDLIECGQAHERSKKPDLDFALAYYRRALLAYFNAQGSLEDELSPAQKKLTKSLNDKIKLLRKKIEIVDSKKFKASVKGKKPEKPK